MATSSLVERMKTLAAANKDKSKSETMDITVLDVNVAPPAKGVDGKEYPKVRVTTAELGNVWLFTSNLHGALSSYGKGVTAKAILVPNNFETKTGEKVEGVQVQSIKIEAIDSKTEAMIKAMPTGAALFSMAV